MLVGNDIVDLKFSEKNSRWQEQRFLDKLFTDEEQIFIKYDDSRFKNIWLLWSMKESVYKIVSQNIENQIYNPKNFKCIIKSVLENEVLFEDKIYATLSMIGSSYIYTTAFSEQKKYYSHSLELCGNDFKTQHLEVEHALIREHSKMASMPENSISIRKNESGVPKIYINNQLQDNSVSITHHGRYGGFAIAI